MDLKEGLQSYCEEENYRGPLPVLNRCMTSAASHLSMTAKNVEVT